MSLLGFSCMPLTLSVGETREGLTKAYATLNFKAVLCVAADSSGIFAKSGADTHMQSRTAQGSAVLWEGSAHSQVGHWHYCDTSISPCCVLQLAPILFPRKQRAHWAGLLHPTVSHRAQLPSPALPGAITAVGEWLLPQPAQPCNFWLIADSATSPGFWPQAKGILWLSRIKKKCFYVSQPNLID